MIARNHNLKALYLGDCNDLQARYLFKALEKSTSLTELILSPKELTEATVGALLSFLNSSRSLQKLVLHSSNMFRIVKGLEKNDVLRYLMLRSSGAEKLLLSPLLTENTTLERFKYNGGNPLFLNACCWIHLRT